MLNSLNTHSFSSKNKIIAYNVPCFPLFAYISFFYLLILFFDNAERLKNE